MAAKNNDEKRSKRLTLAKWILAISGLIIVGLSVTAILIDQNNAMSILSMVLPVLAAWVGTVLAFYFSSENFESANRQIQDLVEKVAPERQPETPVTAVMKRLAEMKCFELQAGEQDNDILLNKLLVVFDSNITRLPVIDSDKKPRYMIHQSRVIEYLHEKGNDENDPLKTNTLETFIKDRKEKGIEFGFNRGFVVASEKSTLGEAKNKLEEMHRLHGCQDIFITKEGNSDEPLLGWLSNVRLTRVLKA